MCVAMAVADLWILCCGVVWSESEWGVQDMPVSMSG